MDSPLLFVNKSILIARTPISSPPRLPVSSSKKNLKRGLTVTHPEVKRLGVKLMFNENIIKLKDNVKYIEEAIDAIVIL